MKAWLGPQSFETHRVPRRCLSLYRSPRADRPRRPHQSREVSTDSIAWLHYGLIEAEELWVLVANAYEMAKSSNVPAIQRLLGACGELGSRPVLDNKWMLQAIKAGGNSAEIFERNVGQASPLKLERGLNAT
jgi:general L-amino acid transport system substrate-binding protein